MPNGASVLENLDRVRLEDRARRPFHPVMNDVPSVRQPPWLMDVGKP